jgi:hypothetical protein
LIIKFNQPLFSVTSGSDGPTSGGAFYGPSALDPADNYGGGTLLLNPLLNIILNRNSPSPTQAMVAAASPHLPLQALSFSKYRMSGLGFSYLPQGQTFQSTPQEIAESRLRFAFTADPTHPVIGMLGIWTRTPPIPIGSH